MMEHCPQCKRKLEKDYKFCPDCGYSLQQHDSQTNANKEPSKEIVICGICGEENNPENRWCTGCGAVLEGKEIRADKKVTINPAHTDSKKGGTKKKSAPKQVSSEKKYKELNKTKLFYILGGIIFVILLILFMTGVFDQPEHVHVHDTPAGQNGSSGVDLSHINRINELERQVNADPNNSAALLELAHLRNDSGMFQAAIDTYQKYLEMVPANADARVDMGVCYFNMQNYEKASEVMKKALEYEPKHQIAHLNLGIVNLSAGNVDESKEWFKKAIEINPNTDIANRAKSLLEQH